MTITAPDEMRGKIEHCISMDGPGFSEEYIEAHKEEIEKAENDVLNFDKNTLSLYKKIPVNSDCSVEDLIDESHTLRDVMQCLLKLEIAKFIVMLPGDRVKRNLK